MDVVLTPMGIHGDAWSLKDRLGRSLGTVQKVENPDGFVIAPDGSGLLKTIKLVHPSLDDPCRPSPSTPMEPATSTVRIGTEPWPPCFQHLTG